MPPQPMPTDQMLPPQGMPPMMGGSEGMPPPPMPEMPPAEMPMEVPPAPPPAPSKGDDLKKRVLQKLMDNLLGKSGRSFNEVVNGIKAALNAYKSYAKEVDLLNGVAPEGGAPEMPEMPGPTAGGSSSDIQEILRGIQQKKGSSPDGAGGPGMQYQPPTIVPPSPQPIPQDSFIAGNPQTSTFSRPAPVNQFGVFGY